MSLRKIQAYPLQRHHLRPLRRRGYRKEGAPRTYGPHRTGGARSTHLVLPFSTEQDWLSARLVYQKLDQIIYYERYAVINPGIKGDDGISYLDFLTEDEYLDIIDKLPADNQKLDDNDPNKFIAKMGADALEMLLARTQLDELSYSLRHQAATDTSQQRKAEALKRLKVVESFRDARNRIENRPEWMIIKMVPVIPPELRPAGTVRRRSFCYLRSK